MQMVSMELDDQAKYDAVQPIAMPDKPDYPPGLCICLTSDECEKLGIDPTEATVGGTFVFMAMARITSVSMNDSEMGGECHRIEAQIEQLGIVEPTDD